MEVSKSIMMKGIQKIIFIIIITIIFIIIIIIIINIFIMLRCLFPQFIVN